MMTLRSCPLLLLCTLALLALSLSPSVARAVSAQASLTISDCVGTVQRVITAGECSEGGQETPYPKMRAYLDQGLKFLYYFGYINGSCSDDDLRGVSRVVVGSCFNLLLINATNGEQGPFLPSPSVFPLATLRTTLLLRNSTDESLTCAPEGPGVAVFGATQFRTGVCTAVVDPQTGVTTSYWDTCTLNGQMTSTFFFSDGACTPSALDVVQSTPTGCYYKGTTHTCPASLNTIPPGTTIPSSGFYYVNKDSSCMPNPQAPFDSAFNAPLDRCQTASDTGSVYKFVCTPADSLGRRNFTLYRYPAGGDCTVDPIDIVTVPYADGRTCDPRTGIVASCVEASSEDGGASSSSGRGGASSSSSSSSTAGACDGEACAASTIRGALAATLAVAIALFIARLQ